MTDMTIYIKKLNEVNGQVITNDFDSMVSLRDKFRFRPEGYQFQPKYKNKIWDGYVRLLHNDGKFPFGLWNDIKSFSENVLGKVVVIDPQIKFFGLTEDRFVPWVDSLDVHTKGESIDPYDYQKDASLWALNVQRGILLSPTSSGKSLIQYLISRMMGVIYPGDSVLIIVPSVGLVKQMLGDFDDYSSNIEWSAPDNMYGIMAGVDKTTDKTIIVSTFQSLGKLPQEWFNRFRAVICDEVHTAKAKTIIGIMNKCLRANYRIGLTGTLDECKSNQMTLKGLFGPVKTVIATKKLMDDDKVAQLQIRGIIIKHIDENCKFLRSALRGPIDPDTKKQSRKKATYAEEIEFLCELDSRNQLIIDTAGSCVGNSILMIHRVEHGEYLYRKLCETYPDRNVFLYTGQTKADDREKIRTFLEENTDCIIVGSLGTISTGISIKRLHNLIMAHPTKSKIKVLQSVGRILRKSNFGNEVNLIDIIDDLSIGAYENYVLSHGRDRFRYYADQQFKFKMENKQL